MKINFGQVEDVKDITKLKPEGDYLCKITKVEEKTGKNSGNIFWNLWWKVQQGEFEGQYIFDKLFFTEGGLKRMKLVLARLGFDVSGEINLEREMLVGKYAMITVEHEKGDDGKERENVPFHGVQAVEVSVEEDEDDEDDKPDF